MTNAPNTIRVVIPLTFRKRNGRPKILPPEGMEASEPPRQDPHVLRAIGRAWGWRRMIESGEVSTITDIARAEKLSDRYVGRMIRLAYLSPDVLEKLVIHRIPPSLSLKDLAELAERPWAEQMDLVFD